MTCPSPETLAAWADREVTLEQHERLTQHVHACARCAASAEQLRTLASGLRALVLAGAAPGFSAELQSKLTSTARGRWPARLPLAAATGLAAALALGLFTTQQTPPARDAEFHARGGSPQGSHVGFEVYVHEPGREAVRLREGERVHMRAGYSFVVFNRSREPRLLLLFALDARADVHWFYPAYLDAASNPQSIEVPATPQLQALPDGITPQAPAPGAMRFIAVFSRAPLFVQDVEALIRSRGLEALSRAHTDVQIHMLRAQLIEAASP